MLNERRRKSWIARQVWEAALWAGKNKLDNLTAIIDRNNIQIDGFTEDIMPLNHWTKSFRLSAGM